MGAVQLFLDWINPALRHFLVALNFPPFFFFFLIPEKIFAPSQMFAVVFRSLTNLIVFFVSYFVPLTVEREKKMSSHCERRV